MSSCDCMVYLYPSTRALLCQMPGEHQNYVHQLTHIQDCGCSHSMVGLYLKACLVVCWTSCTVQTLIEHRSLSPLPLISCLQAHLFFFLFSTIYYLGHGSSNEKSQCSFSAATYCIAHSKLSNEIHTIVLFLLIVIQSQIIVSAVFEVSVFL